MDNQYDRRARLRQWMASERYRLSVAGELPDGPCKDALLASGHASLVGLAQLAAWIDRPEPGLVDKPIGHYDWRG